MPLSDFMRRTHQGILEELGELAGKGGHSGRAARDFRALFADHAAREEEALLPVVSVLLDAEASGGLPPDDMLGLLAPLLESKIPGLEADHALLRMHLARLRRIAREGSDIWLSDIVARTAYIIGVEEERLLPALIVKGAALAGSLEIASGKAGGPDARVPARP